MQAIELNINKLILFIFVLLPSTNSLPPLIGVHPLDEKYYASKVIKCKDGSKTFTRDRVNDDFCDCVDGTDEPGTSACPRGKFYCRNVGSTPQFVFASRVNDQICDCCDGSDEYGSGVHCPNICVMGGNVEYKAGNYKTFVDAKESKTLSDQNLLQKATGLKIVIILQMVLLGCVVIFRKFYRRTRFKRRHHDHEV